MGSPGTLDTSTRFGFEWDRYRALFPHYEEQFRGWIHPLGPGDFAGRNVLDAGCGMGRNSLWAARWGAGSVVAVDEAELAVAAAQETLAELPGVRVERRSLYELPWEERFDLCFCVGVVHHLAEPRRALGQLRKVLRPGGRLVVWLYGHEGNEAWIRFFRLVHPALRRLPPRWVHSLAYACSLPIFLGLKLPFPKSPYVESLSRFPFAHVHKIVFDQLLPALTHYYRRNEVEALFQGAGFAHFEIHHNRGYSWTVVAER
ncbi:MAG: class I SAM-dependent methyltransferase [Myxococcota bacterium]|nr:class I SAM-dependent methyltransferase [Myxococcota bacterium]